MLIFFEFKEFVCLSISIFLGFILIGFLVSFRYITSEDVVEVKGKVACEISSADELTLTELMFSGTLKDATVEQMVALLSCFVWQEKLQDAPKPREELDLLFYQLQETARRVANLQLECKVPNFLLNDHLNC
jgi:superfamily II RNA helicase